MNPATQYSDRQVTRCKSVKGKETPQVSNTELQSPLALSAEDTLDLDANSPLGSISRAINGRTGMDEESAALIALTAVSATLGPSVMLDVPLMGKVNTSLPLVLRNDNPIKTSEVIGAVFSSLREDSYENLLSRCKLSDPAADHTIHQGKAGLEAILRAEELFLEKGQLKLPESLPLNVFLEDSATVDCLKSGLPPSRFRKKIMASFEKWKAHAEDYVDVLDTRVHPTVLAEPLHLSDYEKREGLFGDGGVFSVDEYGIGLLELLAASPATRRRIGKNWSASFTRRPTIEDGQAKMPGWLSSFTGASDKLINQLLNDDILFQTGMPQQALIIRPIFTGKASRDLLEMMEASERFGGHLSRCLNFRRKRRPQVIKFSREALDVLEEVGQYYEEAGRKNSGHLPFLQNRLLQTCKVALLVHFSSGPTFESSLSGKNFRIAHQLLKSAHTQMGQILDSDWHQDDPQQHLEMELEILLMKIRTKGRSTRRNLGRSYHKKPMAVLHFLIDHALEQGLIREDEGMLCLPGQ